MKVLWLGPLSPLLDWLRRQDTDVDAHERPIIRTSLPLDVLRAGPGGDQRAPYDLLVSYNYRHIVPPETCRAYVARAVNLHLSYLPFNRGCHPNVWAHHDGTPSGVSLHLLAAQGWDTPVEVLVRAGKEARGE